jgi:hypothetical protein
VEELLSSPDRPRGVATAQISCSVDLLFQRSAQDLQLPGIQVTRGIFRNTAIAVSRDSGVERPATRTSRPLVVDQGRRQVPHLGLAQSFSGRRQHLRKVRGTLTTWPGLQVALVLLVSRITQQ